MSRKVSTIIVVILLLVAIYTLFVSHHYTLYLAARKADLVGSCLLVQYGGKEIGHVNKIFPTSRDSVLLQLSIRDEVKLAGNTMARFNRSFFGDSYVDLSKRPGNFAFLFPDLHSGDTLYASSDIPLAQADTVAAVQTKSFLRAFKAIVDSAIK